MRKYILEVIIEEENDEFWEELTDTGCDEILSIVESTIKTTAFNDAKVRLIKYEDNE